MAMAMWGMGLMVAPILGPTLGGWITDNWNWRWNFYINLPIGAIAVPDGLRPSSTIRRIMRDRRERGGRVDYPGSLLLVSASACCRSCWIAVSAPIGSQSPWVVCRNRRVGAWHSILLVWHELHFTDPILDLRIFKERAFVHDRRSSLCIAMSFVLVRQYPAESTLPAGIDGLQRVEGGAGAGATRHLVR